MKNLLTETPCDIPIMHYVYQYLPTTDLYSCSIYPVKDLMTRAKTKASQTCMSCMHIVAHLHIQSNRKKETITYTYCRFTEGGLYCTLSVLGQQKLCPSEVSQHPANTITVSPIHKVTGTEFPQ